MTSKELAQWLQSEAADVTYEAIFDALVILLEEDLNSIPDTPENVLVRQCVESAKWGVQQAGLDYYASLK